MSDAISFLSTAVGAVFGYADDLFSSLGAYGLILGGFFIFTVYRMLLVPIIGGALGSGKSDKAKKKKEDE